MNYQQMEPTLETQCVASITVLGENRFQNSYNKNYLLDRIFNPTIEKRHEMIYLQRPTSGNIFRLLIMTMTPTQMGIVPTKMDLVGGSIDAVLPILMLHITRMWIPSRNSRRNDYLKGSNYNF